MTQINTLSPAFEDNLSRLKDYLSCTTLYKKQINDLLHDLQSSYTSPSELLDTLLRTQRIIMIHESKCHEDGDFYEFYSKNTLQRWHDYSTPPVDGSLIQSLADKMYNLEDEKKNDYAMIQTDEGVSSVVECVVQRLVSEKKPWNISFKDQPFKAALFDKIPDQGLKALANYTLNIWKPVTKRIAIVPGLPADNLPDINKDKDSKFQTLTKDIMERIRSGEIHFTLTCIPTEHDAEFDDIPYKDYLKLFFEMCDQPWDEIDKAHQILIKQLNEGKILRFTNEDGTDLTMSIEGMTFANSLIARNVPGSEVFSAPVKESVNGKVVAKGHFSPSGSYRGERIEDITLEFQDGKCISAHANKGNKILNDILDTDDGSRYVGEIGIGTNPYLKQRVANILLVEKISGSFHIALGSAYNMTEYMGVPVKVDNGNKSQIHWDITTILFEKQGNIYLDNELIMENGLYTNPLLHILNTGWESIPEDSRPDYWKNYKFSSH